MESEPGLPRAAQPRFRSAMQTLAPRVTRRPEGLLLVLLAGCAFWSTAIVELLAVITLLVAVLRFADSLRHPEDPVGVHFLPPGMAVLLLMYIGGIIASFAVSGTPIARRPGLVWHPLLLAAVPFLRYDADDLRRAGAVFLCSAAAASIAAALRLSAGHPLVSFSHYVGATTLTTLLCGSMVTGFILVWNGPAKTTVLIWLAEVIIMGALILSTERAAIAVAVVASGLAVGIKWPRWLLLWGLALIGLLWAAPVALHDKLDWLIRGGQTDRYIVWRAGIGLLPHVPVFGFGPESFEAVLPHEAWAAFVARPPSSWHNDVLQATLEHGPIVALTLAGMMIASVSAIIRSRFPRSASTQLHGVGAVLCTILLMGMVNSSLTSAVLGTVTWILMGLIWSERCREKQSTASGEGR